MSLSDGQSFAMPCLSLDHIAGAHQRVHPLSLQKGEAFADTAYARQPQLLSLVLALPALGVGHDTIGRLPELLFVVLEAVDVAGLALPAIQESDVERCMTRVVARARFIEGLDSACVAQAVSEQVASHPEPQLLALAHGVLAQGEFLSLAPEPGKHATMAALTIAETVSDALATRLR